jgi:hypothetical protein
MRKKGRSSSTVFISGESGQALILILVFFLLGSLTIMPTLMHMSTALKTGVSYENKTNEYFTADAGIENGLWRIKYDVLGPTYDPYDFNTVWEYETDPLNNLTAEVTVQNVWIPSDVTLDSLGLSPSQARTMIESEKLVITGTSGAQPFQPYHVKIDFTPIEGDNLTLKSIGIWLPQGFRYDTGNCTLLDNPFADYYPDLITETDVPGGQTVVWSYNPPYPLLTSFPNLDIIEETLTIDFTLGYIPPLDDPTQMPVAITWVLTDMDPSCPNPNDVPISWDIDTRIYKITSATGATVIEAYSSKRQLRNLGNGIPGDYVAIGNSVMEDYYYPFDKRDTLLSETSTNLGTVSPIPSDGDVLYAYLYWSGFRHDIDMFSDTCTSSNFSGSWQNGGDWEYYSSHPYYYRGQHTGDDSRRYLTMINSLDLGAYPSGTQYELSWEQSVPDLDSIFEDTCSNSHFNDWWVDGGDWEYESPGGKKYKAQHSGGDDATRYLTMKDGQNLSGYSSVTLTWDQKKSGTLDSGDYLYFALSSDGGESWSGNIASGSSANLTDSYYTYSYIIPAEYCTNDLKIRYYIAGFGSGKWCYIDNIYITPSYSSSLDGLDFALSANGGIDWSSNIQAFRGDIGDSWSDFTYYISEPYASSSNFKIRFYIVGMEGSDKYVNIDDIKIVVRPPDDSVIFKINGQQVYLDGNDDPQEGEQPIIASSSAIMINTAGTSDPGYSYACYKDVSKLVKTYPENPGEEHHTGNYNYTVGEIYADTGEYVSYAGWSLIVIYSSPTTAGRFIFLRDIRDLFAFNPGHINLDFDNDSVPGGDIRNFLFPEPIRDKYGVIIDPLAAKITCFVGEGDSIYTGDTLVITGQQSAASMYLSNNSSPTNNVWNSASPGMTYPGVDVDTFEVLWEDGILTPKDTMLHLDMDSGTDAWNLIYVIISVRSEIVTSGTGHYLIGGT